MQHNFFLLGRDSERGWGEAPFILKSLLWQITHKEWKIAKGPERTGKPSVIVPATDLCSPEGFPKEIRLGQLHCLFEPHPLK